MHILQQLKKTVGANLRTLVTVGANLRTLVTVAAVLVVAVPAAAWAGHQFGDVSNANVFHGDIDWMADNAVTKGCNPPANDQYCPNDSVTREQMAAFMHRLETEDVFASADHEHTALFGTAMSPFLEQHKNTDWADLDGGASTTVEVPAGHQAMIVARFSAVSACWGAHGLCYVRLLVNGTAMEPADTPFDSSDNNNETSGSLESHAMEWVSATLPSGTYTVTVQVRVSTSALWFALRDRTLVAEAKLTS